MCKNCGISCLKCLVIGFNVVLFIGGITLSSVAGYTAFTKSSLVHKMILKANIQGVMTGFYIMLAVGILMSFVALLGCIGAAKANRVLLGLNLFFVLLLFIVGLVALLLCYYHFKSLEKDITLTMNHSTTHSSTNPERSRLFRDIITFVEKEGKCCGLHGPGDYDGKVSSSCYPESAGKTLETDNSFVMKTVEDEDKADNDVNNYDGNYVFTPALEAYASKTKLPTYMEMKSTTESTFETTSKHGHQVQPYKKGCITILQPVIYAVGGISIAVLVLELLLVTFIGILMCEIGKSGYEMVH